MDKNKRKSVNDKLSKYDYLSNDDNFIEVTEWTNGEGISINTANKNYELTYGELDAINYLSNIIKYEEF